MVCGWFGEAAVNNCRLERGGVAFADHDATVGSPHVEASDQWFVGTDVVQDDGLEALATELAHHAAGRSQVRGIFGQAPVVVELLGFPSDLSAAVADLAFDVVLLPDPLRIALDRTAGTETSTFDFG